MIILGSVISMMASCRSAKVSVGPEVIVRDSIVYRDREVKVPVPPVKIPGDTVKLVDTVPCPDTQWRGTATSTSGRTKLTAEIDKGKIRIDCKTDSLTKVIDSLQFKISEVERYKEKVRTITIEVPKQYIPWWVYLIIGMCVVTMLILLRR